MLKHDAAPPLHVKERGFSPLARDSLKSCYNNFSRLAPTVVSDETSTQKRKRKNALNMCVGRGDGKEKQENQPIVIFPFHYWNSLSIQLFFLYDKCKT